jgi:hypothetical protein
MFEPGAKSLLIALTAALTAGASDAATPPPLVNYQGVLRDNNDKPLSGTYDVRFRFLDAVLAGDEIMVDQHAAVTGNPVAVTGGLFNVSLGSGTTTDGSGPGTYTSLDAVFRDYGAVWLEVSVGGETLSPRTQVQSAPYALNAAQLGGQPAGNFIDTSATQQTKTGRMNVYSNDASGYALAVQNQNSGSGTGVYGYAASNGVFGFATGAHGNGVIGLGGGFGSSGGYFDSQDGFYSFGVFGRGWEGGHFEQRDNSGGLTGVTADLAYSNDGVSGYSPLYGGVGVYGAGERHGVEGHAVGTYAGGAVGGDFTSDGLTGIGVRSSAATGGQFSSTATPGLSVKLADFNVGVNANGGSTAGSFQTTAANSTGVNASGAETGVTGIGGTYGGSFTGNNSGGVGVYGSGSSTGVQGHGGSSGGYFDNAASGNAYAGFVDSGILASGNFEGGEFLQGTASGAYARLAYNRTAVAGYASNAGENPGWFQDLSTGNWASIGQNHSKVAGTGSVTFVQNDPESSSNVIVYAAPEGDEVAVYTRGSGRLVNGEARVPLGPTFRKVANPDLGLTANVTPVGDPIPLAVVEKSTSELVVRGPAGSNAVFDYVVWGLRIGFEDNLVVQPKERESFIPSWDADNAVYQRQPELRTYSARQRFLAQLARRDPSSAAPRMDRSIALEQAIGVYDRARDESRIAPPELRPSAPPETIISAVEPPGKADTTEPALSPSSAPGSSVTIQRGVAMVSVADAAEPGEIVVADPSGGDALRLGTKAADPLVAGIVVAPSPGTLIESGEALIALAGSIVPCRVDATLGAIHAGDLLTSSPSPGFAMRATDATPGTILGKALQSIDRGTGTIRVLVMSR